MLRKHVCGVVRYACKDDPGLSRVPGVYAALPKVKPSKAPPPPTIWPGESADEALDRHLEEAKAKRARRAP